MHLSYSLRLTIICSAVLMCQSSFANEPWSQDRQWLFGDWNGNRQELEEKGYKFTTTITTESASNLAGGYNDDNKTLHSYNLNLGTHFDLEKIKGWKDTEANIMISKRDGQELSGERISMPGYKHFSNVQENYGRGQSWRISSAWIKKGFKDNTVQVKVGRMGLNEDFDGGQCEFQNLILCGNQIGKTNGSIWYNFPVSGWAANVKYQFAPEWSIATGIYEINPENMLENRGFNLTMDETEGAIIPLQLVWTPKFDGKGGEYKIGAYYADVDMDDVKTNANNQTAVKGDSFKSHDDKYSFWLSGQQQLTAPDGNANKGLFATAHLVFNDKSTSTVESTQQLAFWYKGLIDSRPQDSIGLGIAHFDVNSRVADYQRYNNSVMLDVGQPKPYFIQDDEVNIELNYTYRWSPAVMFRPNLQYIYQPGGISEVDNAWVAGLTMQLNF
ncbi:porin [Acinetobacter sp. SFB]|uniref:carbohydrate porin n=1 Tax=Acinetobacter sp. SFB TaxID=1805634 RepID=UPI0007D87BB3|nr:carbohydrate porin [Acinetobacter sp. SFB]OAL76229.1 porin [Acinetobacter sp. SFB]